MHGYVGTDRAFLRCIATEGQPEPTLLWERISGQKVIVVEASFMLSIIKSAASGPTKIFQEYNLLSIIGTVGCTLGVFNPGPFYLF